MMSFAMDVFVYGLVCFVLALNGLFYIVEKFRNKKVSRRPAETIIVITGCDSGFGEMSSKALSRLGYKVIAGCLTEDGINRMTNSVTKAVKCDVTKEEDIAALAKIVGEYASLSGCNVWGVVNNAGLDHSIYSFSSLSAICLGIGDGGNIDWTEMKVWRRVMEVNFFAVVAVTKAMLPLLKKTPGSRVVNVSSLAGITGSPSLGAYCASKHAVEGMAKCVREELSHWNIHMSNINPGFMRTPILTNGAEAAKKSFNAAPKDITSEYGTEWMEASAQKMNTLSEDPVHVINAIIDALTDTHPPMWYFPGNAAKILRIVPYMSSGLVDMLGYLGNRDTVAKPRPEAIKKYR